MSRPTDIRVRETIAHGDYRNVREQTIAPSWDGFCALLAASPYPSTDIGNNVFAARTFADLLTTGRASRGWAEFEVIGYR